MLNVVYTGVAVFFWVVFLISFIRARSRYRNCYLLFFAFVSTVIALTFLAGEHQKQILIILMVVILLALLCVPVFLISNGVLMYEREGHSLKNLLSFIFGLVIGIGEIATFTAVLLPELLGTRWNPSGVLFHISRVSAFVGVSVIYFSATFVVFMFYCIFLMIIPRKRDFDYVIIHGAGLLKGGRISKLLSDRIDKAIDVYHKDPTPPVLIPSGGKGNDEDLSEAEAMTQYLLQKGIPAEKIIMEPGSANTFENLKNSKAIIDAQEDRKYTALVTSNYHVYRALRYCRKIGLKCTGIGSHVAFYYWPSALIREFIAVHREKKHLITLFLGWVLCMALLAWIYFGN